MQLPLLPIWIIDIGGCLSMILLAGLCEYQVFQLRRQDTENPLNTYLLWLISAIFAFSLLRSLGHLLKYVLLISGHGNLWHRIAPFSGGLISVTFVVIFAVTLFFRDMISIFHLVSQHREKIEITSSQLLKLNNDIEAVVSDRTRAELALELAHEIRNPIMIIGGLLKRLCQDRQPSARDQQRIQTILKQTRQLETIVHKFEQLQAQIQDHFAILEVNGLVRESLDIVRYEAEQKHITMTFSKTSSPLAIQGDPHYLKVALLHLLRNSIEACAPGDHVVVTTGHDRQGAVITISDNGPGIPAAVLEHIFEPFYSTKEGATGLGLPYVRQIIHEHRGEISIESSPDQGTMVRLHLPTHLGTLQALSSTDRQNKKLTSAFTKGNSVP